MEWHNKCDSWKTVLAFASSLTAMERRKWRSAETEAGLQLTHYWQILGTRYENLHKDKGGREEKRGMKQGEKGWGKMAETGLKAKWISEREVTNVSAEVAGSSILSN